MFPRPLQTREPFVTGWRARSSGRDLLSTARLARIIVQHERDSNGWPPTVSVEHKEDEMGRRYSGPGGTYIVLRDKRTGKFWIHQKNTTHIESGDRELYPTRDAANAKSQMLAEYK